MEVLEPLSLRDGVSTAEHARQVAWAGEPPTSPGEREPAQGCGKWLSVFAWRSACSDNGAIERRTLHWQLAALALTVRAAKLRELALQFGDSIDTLPAVLEGLILRALAELRRVVSTIREYRSIAWRCLLEGSTKYGGGLPRQVGEVGRGRAGPIAGRRFAS